MLIVLGADLAELEQAMRHCRAAGSLRRLTRVAAQLSGLACLLAARMDDQDEYCHWAQTARMAAAQADDAATLSWVLAQEAYGHFYSGRLPEAVSVARQAQEMMRVTPGNRNSQTSQAEKTHNADSGTRVGRRHRWLLDAVRAGSATTTLEL